MPINSQFSPRIANVITLLLTPYALGAGFQINERSATGLGRAFSGEAAIADEASVLASNPAGTILLGGDWNYSLGATYINPGADATLFPAVTGGNAGAPTLDDDIAEDAVVPYLYLTKRIQDDFAVGLGIFSTYGLRTNYSNEVANLVGTNFSEITSFNINPSFSYRINEFMSIGGGFNALYGEGEITSNAVPLAGAPSFGLEGDDWGFGYNLGVLFELSSTTRIGLSYRSQVELELEGSATGSIVGGATVGSDLEIDLPAIAEFSIYHELSDQWAIHGDILWTQWSDFESLDPRVSTGIPAQDAAINAGLSTPQNWNDTLRFAIGATYQHCSNWTFRGGLSYDESPIDDEFRTLRIPDGDRFSFNVGASYKVNEAVSIDAGYSFTLVDDVNLGQPNNSPTGFADNGLIGSNSIGEGNIHYLSLGLSGSF